MKTSKVWYVTGASQGLGLFLVKKLLERGYQVAATSRNTLALNAAVGSIGSGQFLPLAVDLTNPDSVDESFQQTIRAFGQIDVLVNNAGYGVTGAIEEISELDIQQVFNVNVLALIDVCKSVLPIMRSQRSGNIINIGSIAGISGAPGWSVYAATKAAVAAFSEVLALEVQEFGIKVTSVEPSGFRTGFLTGSSLVYRESKIFGYHAIKETQQRYLANDGKQAGDPDRAAEILISLAEEEKPPLRLFLGKDAYLRASEKLDATTLALEAWKKVTLSSDYPD